MGVLPTESKSNIQRRHYVVLHLCLLYYICVLSYGILRSAFFARFLHSIIYSQWTLLGAPMNAIQNIIANRTEICLQSQSLYTFCKLYNDKFVLPPPFIWYQMTKSPQPKSGKAPLLIACSKKKTKKRSRDDNFEIKLSIQSEATKSVNRIKPKHNSSGLMLTVTALQIFNSSKTKVSNINKSKMVQNNNLWQILRPPQPQ